MPPKAKRNSLKGTWYLFALLLFAAVPSTVAGTTLYLRNLSSPVNPDAEEDMRLDTSPGAAPVAFVTNTQAGPVSPPTFMTRVTRNVGGLTVTWYSVPLQRVTISGNVTFNLWANESNTLANAAITAELLRMDGSGNQLGTIVPVMGTRPELANTSTAQNWSQTPTAMTIYEGERLGLRVHIDDASGMTMAAGRTVSLYMDNKNSGASGDSWVQLAETLVPSSPTVMGAWQDGISVAFEQPGAQTGYILQAATTPAFAPPVIFNRQFDTGLSQMSVSGLAANTSYYLRVGAMLSDNTTSYGPAISAWTAIEPPGQVYFSELTTHSVTASAYASTFTNLGAGMTGFSFDTGGGFGPWQGGFGWALSANTMPQQRYLAAGAAVGGKIFILGGTTNSSNYFSNTYAYDPVSDTWDDRGGVVMATPRFGLSAAVVGGKIYAIGGYSTAVLGTTEVYDPVANTWSSPGALKVMPTPRLSAAAAAVNGKIYVIGGEASGGTIVGTASVYDPAYNTWDSSHPPMNPARRGAAAAVIGNKIYVTGGYNLGYKPEVRVYDTGSKTWGAAPSLQVQRAGHASAAIGGKVYVFSGYNSSYLASTEVFDPAGSTWTYAAPIPVARDSMGYATLNGRLYLAGGLNGGALNDARMFDPGVSSTFNYLMPNTQYSYRVKARNAAGLETGPSGWNSFYTLAVATVSGSNTFTEVSSDRISLQWASGSPGFYNGPNASYRVEASTSPKFAGEIKERTPWDSTFTTIDNLRAKTTYYFRVQAYNSQGQSDHYWTLLGSTVTPKAPLPGTAVSQDTYYSSLENRNWGRSAVRNSKGELYVAHTKDFGGKFRIFVARSADNGDTWGDTTAVPVENLGPYDQAWPALAVDSSDYLHLVWGGNDGADAESKCFYSSAASPGTAWSAPVKIPADPYEGTEKHFNIAVDGNDGLHIAWAGYDGSAMDMVRVRYSSRAANGNWAAFTRVNDVSLATDHPALAIDSKNGVHIVARQATSGGSSLMQSIVHSSRTTGGWYPWNPVYNPGAYQQDGPSLTIDSAGRLFAAWSGTDGTYANAQIKYAIRSAAGAWGGWSYVGLPEPAAPQRHPSAAADAAGKVYVLWSGGTAANPVVNLRGADFDGASWKSIDELSSEEAGAQDYVQLRWAGWRNNGGAIDVLWSSYDGASSTATLRHIYGSDVPMSPGWSKTAWVLPAGCAYAVNVRQDGGADFRDIRGALNALPSEISTNTCVVVRDDGTYREAVVVEGFRYRYWEDPRYRISVMADPTFVSSAPKVAAPQGTYAAFDLRSDSVTVQGFVIQSTDTMNYGVYASSSYARISSVTISGSFDSAALLIDRGGATVSYSTVTAESTGSGAIKAYGGGNTISSVYASAVYNMHSPLWLSNSSSNTITRSVFYHQEGNALTANFSHNNQISFSTFTGRMSSYSAIYFTGSDNNTVSDSYVYSPDGYGVRMENYSDYNSFLNSTVTAFGSSNPAFYSSGSDNLLISGSYIRAALHSGLELNGGSDNAAIVNSTVTGNGPTFKALYINDSDTATVTASVLANPGGMAVDINQSNGNRIAMSGVTNGNDIGLFIWNNSHNNTISRSFIRAEQYDALRVNSDCSNTTVEYSTLTSNGTPINSAALSVAGSSTSVVSSYVQGSTAVYVSGGFAMIRDSVLAATNTYGAGLNVTNAPQGLFMTSSTVRGGQLGAGMLLSYNSGEVELSSNAVTGGAYGLRLGSQNAGFRLQISTINFNALTAGATAIMFTGGAHGATITAAGFHSAGLGINVGAVGLVWPSSITMRGATGPKAGPDYEYDPGGFISWPSARAFKIKPGPADTGLPRSPALYAGANETDGPVQYEFQLDTSAGMDSQAGQPLYKFSQSDALFFPDKGAFSGTDSTVTAYGDAYLPASTATFVFFNNAAQRLSPQTWYFWRVRAKSGGVSYYGDWSITDSFLTGQAASDSPVNNVGVHDVAVSSPTGLSAAITFQLYANDVSSQATTGGGGFNTAQWLFVKFSTQAGADGSWRHATISTGTTASFWNSALTVPADRRGAFVDNSTSQSFWNSTVTLRWNYAEDGVAGPADAQVKVFAISMINVHGGSFVYDAGGIGGAAANNYGGGGEIQINTAADTPSGAALGWPNGYNSFYLMRYELTQGQYADFLNSVHSSTADARHYSGVGNGHSISFNAGNPYGSRYAAADRYTAKNFLSTADLWSWLSWAGLRPPTEMEFEKAARDRAPDSRVYPWGDTAPTTETYSPVHEGGTHSRHYLNYNNSGKVLQAGRYLSGDLPREMEQMGFAPRVIADLAGNVYEHIINCSHSPAPANGGGTEAWPANWPAPDSAAKGLRGGDWLSGESDARVSNRNYVGWSDSGRHSGVGGRGARTR